MTATPEEREAAHLEELRNRTEVPHVPAGDQLWCLRCGIHLADSLFTPCPVCADKQPMARRLSRYLFGGVV